MGARQSASSKSITSVPKPSMATRTRRPPFSAASPHVRSADGRGDDAAALVVHVVARHFQTPRRRGERERARSATARTGRPRQRFHRRLRRDFRRRLLRRRRPPTPSRGTPRRTAPADAPTCGRASASHLSATALIAVLLQLVHPPVVGKDAVALLLHVRQLRVHIGGKPHPSKAAAASSVRCTSVRHSAGVSVAP